MGWTEGRAIRVYSTQSLVLGVLVLPDVALEAVPKASQ